MVNVDERSSMASAVDVGSHVERQDVGPVSVLASAPALVPDTAQDVGQDAVSDDVPDDVATVAADGALDDGADSDSFALDAVDPSADSYLTTARSIDCNSFV